MHSSTGRPTASVSRLTLQRNVEDSSERVRLARTALTAALSLPGVVRGDSGRLHAYTTPVAGSEPLHGVVCAAHADGGYEVALRLVAELVPLQPLARQVGESVRRSADAAGLGPALQRVSVHFADIEYRPAA